MLITPSSVQSLENHHLNVPLDQLPLHYTSEDWIQKTLIPFYWPIWNWKDHQPIYCSAQTTKDYADSSHVSCFPDKTCIYLWSKTSLNTIAHIIKLEKVSMVDHFLHNYSPFLIYLSVPLRISRCSPGGMTWTFWTTQQTHLWEICKPVTSKVAKLGWGVTTTDIVYKKGWQRSLKVLFLHTLKPQADIYSGLSLWLGFPSQKLACFFYWCSWWVLLIKLFITFSLTQQDLVQRQNLLQDRWISFLMY